MSKKHYYEVIIQLEITIELQFNSIGEKLYIVQITSYIYTLE